MILKVKIKILNKQYYLINLIIYKIKMIKLN